MSHEPSSRVALLPEGMRPWIADAIRDGGGTVVEPDDADGLVWADTANAAALAEVLHGEAKQVQWVQLPYAGVEPFAQVIAQNSDRTWACAKGVYAEPVAEHAL